MLTENGVAEWNGKPENLVGYQSEMLTYFYINNGNFTCLISTETNIKVRFVGHLLKFSELAEGLRKSYAC